eukprot:15975_1
MVFGMKLVNEWYSQLAKPLYLVLAIWSCFANIGDAYEPSDLVKYPFLRHFKDTEVKVLVYVKGAHPPTSLRVSIRKNETVDILPFCVASNGENAGMGFPMGFHFPPMAEARNELPMWVCSVNLENMEPGTVPFSVENELYILEAVLTCEEIVRHRSPRPTTAASLLYPPPIALSSILHKEDEAAVVSSYYSICVVGSLSMDGQKTIWLRLARHISKINAANGSMKNQFKLSYLHFEQGEEDDTGKLSAMEWALAEVGVRLYRSVLPPIPVHELIVTEGGGGG